MKLLLVADWNYMFVRSFLVEPKLLQDKLNPLLDLTLFNGKALVQIVGRAIENTKIKGLAISPIKFFDFNLQVKVKKDEKDGFILVKQIVPKYCVANFISRLFYAKAETLPMEEKKIIENDKMIIQQSIWKDKELSEIQIVAEANPTPIESPFGNSRNKFVFSEENGFQEFSIETEHWNSFNIEKSTFNLNHEKLYGKEWEFLKDAEFLETKLYQGSYLKVFV